MKSKTYIISLHRAQEIAANHNNVSIETAKGYSKSELIEVLSHLRIKAHIV